ncbi:unnamed protein product [Rhizophagus irregularis]|nr:unnamed protein product [Rhizophagus irregularis]
METNEAHKKSISDEIRKRNKEKKLSKAGQSQVSLQKVSDTVTSGNTSGISSEKPVSAKNGQGLVQEISRNFDESGTPSSIRDYDSTCVDSKKFRLPRVIIYLYQRASDAEGLAMKANQKEILN